MQQSTPYFSRALAASFPASELDGSTRIGFASDGRLWEQLASAGASEFSVVYEYGGDASSASSSSPDLGAEDAEDEDGDDDVE